MLITNSTAKERVLESSCTGAVDGFASRSESHVQKFNRKLNTEVRRSEGSGEVISPYVKCLS
jgi:hypothetical protein